MYMYLQLLISKLEKGGKQMPAEEKKKIMKVCVYDIIVL